MNLKLCAAVQASALLFVLRFSEAAIGASHLYVTNNLTNNNPGGRLLDFDGVTGQFISLLSNVNTPRGIKQGSDGSLYVASGVGDSVLKFSLNSGVQQTTFVSPGSGGLDSPSGLTFGPDNNLYVTSGSLSTNVLRYDGTTGSFMNVFATVPTDSARDLVFGPNGNLYVATTSHGIYQFNGQTGASLGNFVPATNFTFAEGITFGPDQNLYIATESGDSVLRYNGTTGAFINAFVPAGSGGLNGATGVGFGPDGNLYVAGLFNDQILRYNGQTGAFIGVFASTPIDAPFYFVFSVPEPDCSALALIGVLVANCRRVAAKRKRSLRE